MYTDICVPYNNNNENAQYIFWKSNRPLCLLAISHEVQLCRNMNTSEFNGAYTPSITPFVPPQALLQICSKFYYQDSFLTR